MQIKNQNFRFISLLSLVVAILILGSCCSKDCCDPCPECPPVLNDSVTINSLYKEAVIIDIDQLILATIAKDFEDFVKIDPRTAEKRLGAFFKGKSRNILKNAGGQIRGKKDIEASETYTNMLILCPNDESENSNTACINFIRIEKDCGTTGNCMFAIKKFPYYGTPVPEFFQKDKNIILLGDIKNISLIKNPAGEPLINLASFDIKSQGNLHFLEM